MRGLGQTLSVQPQGLSQFWMDSGTAVRTGHTGTREKQKPYSRTRHTKKRKKERERNSLNITPKTETRGGKKANQKLRIPGRGTVANALNAPVMEENASKESWRKEERSKARLTPHLLRSEGCATYSVVLCKAGSHRARRCTIMLITRIC